MTESAGISFNEARSSDSTKDSRRESVRLEEVDILLTELAAAAASSVPPSDFVGRLLRAATQAAHAVGGAVWTFDVSGGWRAEYSVGTVPAESDKREDAMRSVAATATIRSVALSAVQGDAGTLSVIAPMAGRGLELVVHNATAEPQRRLLAEIARSFAEVGAEFFNRHELDSLRIQIERARHLEEFTRSVYRPLAVGPTSFAIVNDGRTVVGCDRLTVVDARRGHVLAVSGVDFPDRRSDVVRHIERLSREVLAAGGRYWRFRGDRIESDLGAPPPSLAAAWDDYRDLVSGVAVDIVVLFRPTENPSTQPVIGTLLAEWFGDAEQATPDRLLPVAIHAGQALHHSLEATPGPIDAVLRRLTAPWRLHRSKTVIAGVLFAAVLLALTFIRVDFVVATRGRLVPEETRDVFAPADAVVLRLDVRPGDDVAQNTVLLELADPLLDLEQERIIGELGTARQRLLAVQAERATSGRVPEGTPRGSAGLAADEKELTEQIASLSRQLEILKVQQESLTVRSPISGTVLTWEADERLENRPVRRGQRLMTIANGEGDWRLELFVPDSSAGHVLKARDAIGPNLAIDYLLATEPQATYRAVLDRVALSTEADDQGSPSLRVSARLPHSEVPAPRPGATVVANVHCGRRAVGYVWFHEFYEAFLTHVWF